MKEWILTLSVLTIISFIGLGIFLIVETGGIIAVILLVAAGGYLYNEYHKEKVAKRHAERLRKEEKYRRAVEAEERRVERERKRRTEYVNRLQTAKKQAKSLTESFYSRIEQLLSGGYFDEARTLERTVRQLNAIRESIDELSDEARHTKKDIHNQENYVYGGYDEEIEEFDDGLLYDLEDEIEILAGDLKDVSALPDRIAFEVRNMRIMWSCPECKANLRAPFELMRTLRARCSDCIAVYEIDRGREITRVDPYTFY